MTQKGKKAGNQGPLSKDYDVGYGKPPKEHQFKSKAAGASTTRAAARKAIQVDVAALCDQPMRTSRNGRQVAMHFYEAALRSFGRDAVIGKKLRSIREFIRACAKAGLLDPPPSGHRRPVVIVPKGVPMHLAPVLLRMAGEPPWSDKLIASAKAEYIRARSPLDELYDRIADFDDDQ